MNAFLAVTAALSATVATAKLAPELRQGLEHLQRDGISATSSFGRQLLQQSRRVEQAATYASDISFVADYSIKFQGCHHVTQWATDEELEEQDEADDGNEESATAANNRIRSKGLVRYRLCPTDKCMDRFSLGCSANYGEYVVDMTAFLQVYIAWMMEMTAYNCEKYSATCFTECYESTSANCYQKCYKKYDVNAALCANNGQQNYDANADAYSNYDSYAANAYGDGNQFDLETYIACGEYEVSNDDGEEIAHYLGPYCADQGGDIRLGFFQDATCSIPSSYQASYFEKLTGVEIPYTKKSLIETKCMTCASTDDEAEAQGNQDYYNYDADGNRNYYIAKSVNDMCGSMYVTSGKCESQFDQEDQPYPEEGACGYIESVKQLQGDGIIRSDQKLSSKPAAVAIGVFTGGAVLLGGYVYHLKSMIARSSVNLAGATTSLA